MNAKDFENFTKIFHHACGCRSIARIPIVGIIYPLTITVVLRILLGAKLDTDASVENRIRKSWRPTIERRPDQKNSRFLSF